jgi:3-phenylpropionate/cinnamic acid dioxygenase small subunit
VTLSDADEITALVHSYARLLDGDDLDGVVSLFEHSTWRSLPNGSVLRGSAEVRPVYETLLAEDRNCRTKHLITNLTVDIEPGSSAATSHCCWTVLRSAPGEPISITLSGQYTDSFEKVDNNWRFTDRLITVDMTSEGP